MKRHNPARAFYGIAAALWLAGFVSSLMPWAAQEAQNVLLAVVFFFSSAFFVLAVCPLGGLRVLMRSPLSWLALAFWALAGLSVVFSEVRFASFIYFTLFSILPLSFLMVAGQGRTSEFLSILAWGLAGLLAALSLFSLIQFFFMPSWLAHGLVHWPLANPNGLGALLSLGFFGALGWMLSAQTRTGSNAALVLAILTLAALMTTGSRGAALALIGGLGVFVVLAPAHFKKHWRCFGLVLGGGAVMFAVLSFIGPASNQGPLEIAASTITGHRPLLWSRPAIWDSAWQIFQTHFWTGTGIGTFFLYYPEMRTLADPSSSGLMVHSDPLQFAVEMGAFAPLVFYAFVLAALVRTLKALKNVAADDAQRVRVLAPMCGLGAMVIHAHISFPFHILPLLALSGMVLGYWFIQTQRVDLKEEEPHQNLFVRAGCALPLLLILSIFSQFQASEIRVTQAKNSLNAGQTETAVSQINRAGFLSHTQNVRALMLAVNLQLGVLQLNAPFMPRMELKDMYDKTRTLLDQAQRANPRLVQISYHRAELESYAAPFMPDTGGEKDQEINAYLEAALRLDPLYLPARVKLANLALRKGEKAAALEILKAGLDWRYHAQNPRSFLEKTHRLALELGDRALAARVEAMLPAYEKNQ